ncbi:MAG: relaxase MobL, partial [Culicoidibacterales bacterium]
MSNKQPILIYNQRYLDLRNETSGSRSKQTRDTMAYLLRKDAIAGADQSKQQVQEKLPADFITEADEKSVMLKYGAYRPGSTGAFNQTGMLDRSGIEAIKQEMEGYRGIQWNGVFSLPDYETAARVNLVTVDDYQRLLTAVMPKYFASQQLQPENMQWVAMHHINTPHPHCHILFWEREATKNRGNFQKGFERTFKQFVAKELNLYHEIKTELWQLDCFEKNIRTDLKVMIEEQNPWLEDQLLRIVDELPIKGRIQYQAVNCDEIRPLVDEVIEYCLQTYLQPAYQPYKQTQVKIIEFDQTLYGEADRD